MLSKDKRLNLSKNFKDVRSSKLKKETESLRVFYKYSDNKNALVGIALTKGIFKKAHERNRARRLASFAIEKLYPRLPNNLNLVIMPKLAILEKSGEEVLKEVEDVKFFNPTD